MDGVESSQWQRTGGRGAGRGLGWSRMPRAVLDKRLIFVTGKGGVGKTTVSAALGLAAARRGRRTIVCELAGQERVPAAFRGRGVGFSETELRPNLYAISIDPDRSLEEYLRDQIGSRTLYRLLFENRIFQYFAAATPGLRELVTIGKVWELAQPDGLAPEAAPYDLVIVDAPASGHGLGILRTPRTFREVARGGPIRRQAGSIHDFFVDPDLTGVVAVALPEEMPVTETLEFRAQLDAELGMAVDRVVMNGLYPERFGPEEVERLAGAVAAGDGRVSPAGRSALAAALSEQRRARVQREQLDRLTAELERQAATAVVELPFLFEADLDLDAFERLANELEGHL